MVRLGYIAGKRANETGEYFRHAACKADMEILTSLLGESAAWVSASLGPRSEGITVNGDNISFMLQPSGSESIESDRTRILIKDAIVARTIYLWLRLTGLPGYERSEEEAMALLKETEAEIRKFPPLHVRPINPI